MQFNNLKVCVICPVSEGVSNSSGRPWKRQDVVLGWDEKLESGFTRTQNIKVTMFGETVDQFAAMRPVANETVISCELVFRTDTTKNGFVVNDVRMYL